VGRDLLGGSFCYDPFDLYAAGVLTNPNMVVLGQIGRGKSSLVKTYLWRQSLLGAQAWVIDPKGEYAPLAAAWGVAPLALAPGGPLRLNPLEGPASGMRADDRRAALLGALAEACLGRALNPRERACLDLALVDAVQRSGGRPLIPHVVDALMRPDPTRARSLASDAKVLAEDGREVALELRRLVAGVPKGLELATSTRSVPVGGVLGILRPAFRATPRRQRSASFGDRVMDAIWRANRTKRASCGDAGSVSSGPFCEE